MASAASKLRSGAWARSELTEDPSHGEIGELLGAYALGAVNERERAAIDAHLETCESCRAELADHTRVAEALRRHASRVSPLASIESNGAHRTPEEVPRLRLVRRWEVPVAMAIVLVIVTGLILQIQIRSDRLDATVDRIELLERAQLAAGDPTAVVTTLRTPENVPVLTVVSRPGGGDSYVINIALPPPADGQTYQLWRVHNGAVTVAVALGPRLDVVMFSLPSGVTGFVLTVERHPDPRRPTLPAVASGGAR